MEKKITILLTSLVLAALAIGSIGFVLADTGDPILSQVEGEDIPCLGLGPRGLIEGRGVWANLTQDQSDELVANIEALRDADATHEEIREYIAGKLDEWGLEAPMWSGPLRGYGTGLQRPEEWLQRHRPGLPDERPRSRLRWERRFRAGRLPQRCRLIYAETFESTPLFFCLLNTVVGYSGEGKRLWSFPNIHHLDLAR